MSDQPANGNGDRATVALVNSKMDTVLAVIAGHAETTSAKLDALTEKVDAVAGLPERVTRLEERPSASPERMTSIEERVSVLEKAREQVRVHWPSLIPALLAVGIAAAALFL